MTVEQDIDAMLATLERLGDLETAAVPAIAEAIERTLDGTARAGTTPDGQPWAPRKKDGGRTLQHAAEAIRVTYSGDTVFVRLTGPDARHHHGAIRGKVKRQVIPNSKRLPDLMVANIQIEIAKVFDREVSQ